MRKLPLLLITMLLVVIGLAATAVSAEGEDGTTPITDPAPSVEGTWQDPAYQAQVRKTYRAAVRYQKSTHRWSHLRGVHGPKGVHRPLKMTRSLPYEQWRAGLWRKRSKAARANYQQWMRMWNNRNRSISRAIPAAAAHYGVSASHLHSCVSSEGGHGAWVWNSSDGRTRTNKTHPLHIYPSSAEAPAGSSGAGGWFQFMSGTFWSDVKHTPIPRKFRKWDSPVGQAYAAAWHFKYHGTGAWTGPGC